MKKTIVLAALALSCAYSSCTRQDDDGVTPAQDCKLSSVRIDSVGWDIDEVIEYDNNNQLSRIEVINPNAVKTSITTFARDADGKIVTRIRKKLTDNFLDSLIFVYNSQGQVIEKVRPGSSYHSSTKITYNQPNNTSRISFTHSAMNNGTAPSAFTDVTYDSHGNPVEFKAFSNENGVAKLKITILVTYSNKPNVNQEFFIYGKDYNFVGENYFVWKELYNLIYALAPNQVATVKFVPADDPTNSQLINAVNTYDNAGNLTSQKFGSSQYGGASYTYSCN